MKDERKTAFIRALAEFLAGDSARKSIELEMGKQSAKEWAALRGACPVARGWQSVDETESALVEWLL